MRTKAFWPAVLSLALACGDGGTGPSIPTVGTIGPIPDGLTGKVAFVISGVVTSSGGSHVESKVHMIDMASPADRVIYTAPPNFSIQGLTWAPSAQNVVVQTTLFQVDPDGHNTSIWQFHSVTTAGADTPFGYGRSGPLFHPAYSPNSRLAYFGGFSDDPTAGIFVDGSPIHPVPFSSSSYLSWRPDVNAIIYSGLGIGLQELKLDGGAVRELFAREGDETIQEPAVSPDGSRFAMLRLGGNRNLQEIWTIDSAGANPQQLTAGFGDGFPAWTPNGTYLAFSRYGGNAPGIYVMPSSGGTPVRVVAISSQGTGPMAWSR